MCRQQEPWDPLPMWLIVALLTIVAPPRNRMISSSQAAHSALFQRKTPWSPVNVGCRPRQFEKPRALTKRSYPSWLKTAMADKQPTTHPPQGCPEPMLSMGLRYPRSDRTDTKRDGYQGMNQELDTYKLKWWMPTSSTAAHFHTWQWISQNVNLFVETNKM